MSGLLQQLGRAFTGFGGGGGFEGVDFMKPIKDEAKAREVLFEIFICWGFSSCNCSIIMRLVWFRVFKSLLFAFLVGF